MERWPMPPWVGQNCWPEVGQINWPLTWASSTTVRTVTRALSLRASRKKKDETIESPSLASQRGIRMCRFPAVGLGCNDLSNRKRNTTRMHALDAFRRNDILCRLNFLGGRVDIKAKPKACLTKQAWF